MRSPYEDEISPAEADQTISINEGAAIATVSNLESTFSDIILGGRILEFLGLVPEIATLNP